MSIRVYAKRLCSLSQDYHEADTTIVTVGGYDCCGPTFAGINRNGWAEHDH